MTQHYKFTGNKSEAVNKQFKDRTLRILNENGAMANVQDVADPSKIFYVGKWQLRQVQTRVDRKDDRLF